MEVIPGVHPRLVERARRAADWLHERKQDGDTVTVVHHIDADGVSAGAIAQRCLERAGIPHRMLAAKSLDDVHLDQIRNARADALWFCDFGSTAYMHFPDTPRLVCDHHELVRDGSEEEFAHLNPLLDDLPGDSISGAGCAFLAAMAHDPDNIDLIPIALVGAAGDLQDRDGLHGANACFAAAGSKAGLLDIAADLPWFGPETRSLRKFLAYGDEPKVPGISGDRRGVEALLGELGIPLDGAGGERTYRDLDEDERLRLRSAILDRLMDCGLPLDGIWRDVVRLPHEPPGPTCELREFATLLNSTARYDEPEVGLAVAAGDRDAAYQKALGLRNEHKANLVQSLDAFRVAGIQETTALQWVHLEDRVRDTVVGIVCGMALGGLGLRQDRPLIGLAHTPDGRTKVSSRAPSGLAGRIDLATAMRDAAASVEGQGGGHKGAAGATIPRGSEATFLARVDAIVAGQLGLMAPPAEASAPPGGTVPGSAQAGAATTGADAQRTGSPSWSDRKGQTRLF